MEARVYIPVYEIGQKVLVIKKDSELFSFCGNIIAHINKETVKVKFDFTKTTSPKPFGWPRKASNISFQIFDTKEVILATKISRLLYG